jgi:hypothetical protein
LITKVSIQDWQVNGSLLAGPSATVIPAGRNRNLEAKCLFLNMLLNYHLSKSFLKMKDSKMIQMSWQAKSLNVSYYRILLRNCSCSFWILDKIKKVVWYFSKYALFFFLVVCRGHK